MVSGGLIVLPDVDYRPSPGLRRAAFELLPDCPVLIHEANIAAFRVP